MIDASHLFARNFIDVKYDDLPEKVVDETKKQLLDYIGVALGGYGQAGAKEIGACCRMGGAQSTIIDAALRFRHLTRLSMRRGAFPGFDDVHEAAIMHPGVITISTALAVGEYAGGLSGKDFIQAVAVGGDMISRMGLATRPGDNVHKYGWHLTTLNGFMTSAAVASKVMGLTEEQMINAIGIGYHQSSGKAGVMTES